MTLTSVLTRPAAEPVERLGPYHLLTPLAQGGLGTVHLGVAGAESRRLLAIKVLRPELCEDAEFLGQFEAESRRALRLSHPNIAPPLDVGCDGDRHFVVREFVAGPTLRELLERAAHDPRVPLALQLQWLCDVLSALHAAHSASEGDRPHVHGRLGPHNVFVTYQGQIKLADFGGGKRGKFAYAAPEQVLGYAVDARADVFAAGVMLWEMATGRAFALHEPNEETLRARTTGSEPRLALAAPLLSPELATICDRALKVDPEARYPSAEAFRLELAGFLRARGDLAEAAAIGELVRTLFAEERAGMQELVRAQIRRLAPADDTEHSATSAPSTVRRTTPIASVMEASGVGPGWFEARPSKVPVPMSSLAPVPSAAERTSATHVSAILRAGAIARARRRKRVRRTAWLLGTAGAAFAAAFVWMRARLEPADVQPTAAPPLAASVTVQPAPPAQPTAAATLETSQSAATSAPPAEQPASAPRHAGPRRSAHKTPSAPPPAAPAPPPPSAAAPIRILPAPPPAPVVEPAPPRPLEIGDDLRVRRREHPRQIERENPFQ